MNVAEIDTNLFDTQARFQDDWDARNLIFFLLNVGDGDTQMVVLPSDQSGLRRVIVVDVATVGKLQDLLNKLENANYFSPKGYQLDLLVATHPHADHIGGFPDFLANHVRNHLKAHDYGAEFWEPGYYHPTPAFFNMMNLVEDLRGEGYIWPAQPTSGFTRYVGNVRVTVLAPGIGLRNRYDTYGVDINNASIALQLEFPASQVYQSRDDQRRYIRRPRANRLILGGDAQTLSWGQAMVDFPQLEPQQTPAARALKAFAGSYPLRAQVLKIPHHASKRGINLELMELIQPRICLVSSEDGGRYRFPHQVALDVIREAINPVATTGLGHDPDHKLGIHHTSACDTNHQPLGTIAVVMTPRGPISIWRFRDDPGQMIDLNQACRYTDPGP